MKTKCAVAILLAWATSAAAITVDTVPVGSPGNPIDTRHNFQSQHFGAVAYNYRIGTYEVTNAQYAAFLNTVAQSDPYGLYNSQMGSDPRGGILRSGTTGAYAYSIKPPALNGAYTYDNKPVELVNWFDAIRFVNWLSNGQAGPGTTEDGDTRSKAAPRRQPIPRPLPAMRPRVGGSPRKTNGTRPPITIPISKPITTTQPDRTPRQTIICLRTIRAIRRIT